MKTDKYTKTILTIIAGALVVIVFQQMEIFPKANAAKINSFLSVPVNPDGSINVKFIDEMKVNITSVGGSSVYSTLPINLKEFSGSSINTSYGIPVNVEAVDGSTIFEALPVKIKN